MPMRCVARALGAALGSHPGPGPARLQPLRSAASYSCRRAQNVAEGSGISGRGPPRPGAGLRTVSEGLEASITALTSLCVFAAAAGRAGESQVARWSRTTARPAEAAARPLLARSIPVGSQELKQPWGAVSPAPIPAGDTRAGERRRQPLGEERGTGERRRGAECAPPAALVLKQRAACSQLPSVTRGVRQGARRSSCELLLRASGSRQLPARGGLLHLPQRARQIQALIRRMRPRPSADTSAACVHGLLRPPCSAVPTPCGAMRRHAPQMLTPSTSPALQTPRRPRCWCPSSCSPSSATRPRTRASAGRRTG